jgi:hypothetical protein
MMTVPSNEHSCAIVIAGKYASFKTDVAQCLAHWGQDVTFCDNIYLAVGQLSQRQTEGQIIVVGSLADLSREEGGFFQICSRRKNVKCLCFINENGQEQKAIVRAVNKGALIISDIDEFRAAAEKLIQSEQGKPLGSRVVISHAELEALLEGQ